MSGAVVHTLPVLWAMVVLAIAWHLRPRTSRLALMGRAEAVGRPTVGGRLGGRLRRWARRPADAGADVRWGRTMVFGVIGAVLDLRLGLAVAVAVFVHPVVQQRRAALRHRDLVVRELPEVIDLLRLSFAGGGSSVSALRAISGTKLGPITEAMAGVHLRVDRGHRVADALNELIERTGPEVRPLVRALLGAEHYGTELLPTLERLGVEAREHRRRRAQAAARRVPIRLLMPLVLCILPAFVLLTLVPTLAGTLDGLDL